MKKNIIGWVIFMGLATYVMPAKADILVCPDLSLGEAAEDCPWAAVARTLSSAAIEGTALRPLLASSLPGIEKQIVADAKLGSWQELWGRSINYDELAKGIIVDPAILDMIFETAKAPVRQDRIVHAGLEHTYGYLFSTLRTPYGYKRARWVRDDIEAGFGLPRGSLGPDASAGGTLFANVSFFIGRIAFRNDAREQAVLLAEPANAAAALTSFDFAALKPARLEETVQLAGDRKIVLRTDLVPFTVVDASRPNSLLLVYSYTDSAVGGSRLISAFPVAQSFVGGVLNPAAMGEGKPVVTRYNAFVPGLTDAGAPVLGTRIIVNPLQ